MVRFFKITGILLAGILFILVVTAVLLPFLVDANSFKPEIETRVESATGRDFAIEGDIELSVFPWLGLDIGRTRLGQPAGFGDGDFASIEGVRVGVRLLPLLRKKLDVDQIELRAPVIYLEKGVEGNTNWEGLADSGADGVDAEQVEASKNQLPEIDIAGFSMTDGRVRYVDKGTGQEIAISALNLGTGRISLPVYTTVSLDAFVAIEQDGERQFTTPIDFKAEIHLDPDAGRYALKKAVLDAELEIPALNSALPITLELADVTIDLDKSAATLGSIKARSHDAMIEASATVSHLDDQPLVEGSLAVPEFDLRSFLERLEIVLPETSAQDAFSSLMAAGEFAATASSVRFSNVEITFDETSMTGDMGIADIETQAIEFDLKVDAVDADRYLAPAAESGSEPEAPASEIDFDSIELPRELIRSLDVTGQAVIGNLKLVGFRMSDVTLGVTAGNGRVRLHPLDADFYDGGYRGDITFSAGKDDVRLVSTETVRRFQLGPMTRDVMDIERLSGTSSLEINVESRGKTVGDWLRNMNGDFRMDARDGTVEGFNLWSELRGAYARLKKRDYDATGEPDNTRFADLDASGEIVKGIIENRMIDARLPFLGITGSGSIDPLAKTLEYSLDVTVLDKPELDATLDSLRGVTIPVRITGSLLDPVIRPEIDAALKQLAKEKAEEKLDAAKAEARRKLEEEKEAARKEAEEKLKDKLKDFFN